MLPQKIIGETPSMKQILKTVEVIAQTDAAILLRGESGTGKELIAWEIHRQSPRKEKPFLPVNCGAIPENLLESELFGHEKGAFTGAFEQHKGKFEAADGGTIFLDEINSLPLLLQSKLLRVIPSGEITRVGGNTVIHVDVRVISATNSSPEKLVAEGKLREDLYYRLNVVPIVLPPLRERKEDIPLLLDYYINVYAKKYNKSIKGFSPDALAYLSEHDWPGNVRELQNLVERLAALENREWIHAEALPQEMTSEGGGKIIFTPFGAEGASPPAAVLTLEEQEKEAIRDALKQAGGNRSRAAEILGIHRNTLMKKLKELGLEM